MTDLNRSWLVQRLNRPSPGFAGLGDNPFSFGGGLRNGGLSDDAMKLLRPIFSFDYMGAAEFEFGAVPKALQKIAETSAAGKLATDELSIGLASVPSHWEYKGEEPGPDERATIYLLADAQHLSAVAARVAGWATESINELKEQTRLSNVLRPYHEWDKDTIGWLELNNGFMFFVDRDAWLATATLFGIDMEEDADV